MADATIRWGELKQLLLLMRGDKKWLAVIAGSLAISVMEAIAALFMYSLIAALSGSISVGGDIGLPDRYLPGNGIAATAGWMAAFFVLKGIAYLLLLRFQQRAANELGMNLSIKLFAGYLRLPYIFHVQRNSAESIRNADQSVRQIVDAGVLPLIGLVSETFIVAGVAIVLLFTSPVASALAIAIIAVASVTLLRTVQPRMARYGKEINTAAERSIAFLQQSLRGIRDIKIMSAGRYVAASFSATRRDIARATYQTKTLLELPRVTMETVLLLSVFAALATGLLAPSGSGEPVAILGLFAYAGLRMLPSVNRIVGALNTLKYSAAAINDVQDDLARIDAVDLRVADGARELSFRNDIVLEEISFTYPGSDTPAIRSIDLTIPKGSRVGIMGPTGGGKSTLIDLLAAVLEPDAGRLLVDGVSVRGKENEWWSHIALVPQTVFLLDDTILRNVAFAVSDNDIDESAVLRAIRGAQLATFLDQLPEGLDSVVGEQGIRLSGGQRQRIAIARALYKQPSLLIFDEGTSALDPATEDELIRYLMALDDAVTIVLVAHRLSSLTRCDLVVSVENGEIAHMGTFEEVRLKSAAASTWRL